MNNDIHKQRILILDFGSQYTQLIARRVREIGVYCEIWPWDVSDLQIREFAPQGIILSGGPESVHAQHGPVAPMVIYQLNVPILGICYGLHTMAMQLGGKVEPSDLKEFGYARVDVIQPSRLLAQFEDHRNEDQPAAEHQMLHIRRIRRGRERSHHSRRHDDRKETTNQVPQRKERRQDGNRSNGSHD